MISFVEALQGSVVEFYKEEKSLCCAFCQNVLTSAEGRFLDVAEATKRKGFLAGTRWRNHFRGETRIAHAFSPRLSWEMEGTQVDGFRSGFADDLFIKDEPPDHTAESAKCILLHIDAGAVSVHAEPP